MKNLLFLFLFFPACTTIFELPQDVTYPISKIFVADYDEIWTALVFALENYPVEEENKKEGYMKTGLIKGDKIWKLPFNAGRKWPGFQYRIYIYLLRGNTGSEKTVQVQVLKKAFTRKGFIGGLESVPSDGLEEKSILYRVFREIQMDQATKEFEQKDML